MIPFRDGLHCYINTCMKSSWITWRTVWSSCTLVVTFSSKQLCYQARQSTDMRNIWRWMKQDSSKDPNGACGQTALSTQAVCKGTDRNSSPSGSDVLLFFAALRRKSSTSYWKKNQQPQIDWNYPPTLNHLYLHRHTPLELLKIAAQRNLISTSVKHLLVQPSNISVAPV